MFDNAWRLERDLFFSPVMNGQNWKAVHDQLSQAACRLLGSREDLNWLIGQVNGEMGNSHTYVGGGDDGDTTPKVHPGAAGRGLGARRSLGPLQVRHHLSGRQHARGLSQPAWPSRACTSRRATIVLAINGQDLRAPADPDSLLQLTDAEQTVDLTIADSAERCAAPCRGQAGRRRSSALREPAWIDAQPRSW